MACHVVLLPVLIFLYITLFIYYRSLVAKGEMFLGAFHLSLLVQFYFLERIICASVYTSASQGVELINIYISFPREEKGDSPRGEVQMGSQHSWKTRMLSLHFWRDSPENLPM